MVILREDLPDSKEFFNLYETTGWRHPFDEGRLF